MSTGELTERLRAGVARWELKSVTPLAETATSWVLRVGSPNGTHALKLLKPYGRSELNGARLMQWWDGDCAARIDAIEGDDVLMEWLEGATLGDMVRADNDRDEEAVSVLGDLIAGLHRRRLAPHPALVSLELQMAPLLQSDLAFLPREAVPLWMRAKEILVHLMATTTDCIPLHGDLHHDNVIGHSGGWRVIDPKGLLGDPVFDGANLFRNPYPADALVISPTRVDRLANFLAQRLGWSRRRILEWACVLNAISAIWTREGENFSWELRMAPVLFEALDQQT